MKHDDLIGRGYWNANLQRNFWVVGPDPKSKALVIVEDSAGDRHYANALMVRHLIEEGEEIGARTSLQETDPNACQCRDEYGNPLNQCDECPR